MNSSIRFETLNFAASLYRLAELERRKSYAHQMETTGSSSGSIQLRPFSKLELLLKERICSQREQIFSFKSSSLWYKKSLFITLSDLPLNVTIFRNCVCTYQRSTIAIFKSRWTSVQIIYILSSSTDVDGMTHSVIFQLGFHCLSKLPLRGLSKYTTTRMNKICVVFHMLHMLYISCKCCSKLEKIYVHLIEQVIFSKMSCLYYVVLSVPCSLVTICWERANIFVLLCVMFPCVFVTFPYGASGQVWYLIVSILEICLLIS